MRELAKFTFSVRVIAIILVMFVSSRAFSANYSYRFESILIASDPERSLKPLSGEEVNYIRTKDHQIHTTYSEGIFWLRGTFPSEVVNSNYLVLSSPLTGKLTLYIQDERGQWQLHGVTGSAIEWEKRSTPSYFAAFKVDPNLAGRDFILKRDGHHLLDASLMLMSGEEFEKLESERSNILLFYAGAAFALLIYNIFLFSICRERVYGLYSAFIFVLMGTSLNVTGGLDYLIAGAIVPSEYLMLFSSASVFFAILFSRKFVEFSKYAPKFDYWSKRITFFPVFIFFTYLFFNSSIKVRALLGFAIDATIVITLLFLVVGSMLAHRKGSPMAKFYLYSWVVLVLGVFIYVGGVHGLFRNSLYTQWGVLAGNLGEMLLLSLALAYRMRVIEAERTEMEVRARDKERYQRLVRVLCHDISNPLSVVKNYATLMERKSERQPEKMKPMAQKVSRASLIIEDLILRVRNFEALEHEQKLNLSPINLKDIISEASFLAAQKITAKQIELDYKSEQLDIFVLAEKTSLLANVVMNAISNAIKFSDIGGVIEIKTRLLGDSVELSISDRGLGMGSEQLENFRLRGQVEVKRGTSGERGSGLGMNLMKSYMDLYQGSIAIVSTPRGSEVQNSGTTIFLTFKRANLTAPQSHTS